MTLRWKIGFEIELLAPRGSSRRTLARALAREFGGRVRPVWHPDAEPSALEGREVFFNLNRGYEVLRGGRRLFLLVDDITLQDDLRRTRRPSAGWFRIVSDDRRLLELIRRRSDPTATLASALRPVAAVFGRRVERLPNGMHRLTDSSGSTIALACPLPGERERACEVITAPVARDHRDLVDRVLRTARRAGFTAPREGAVHLHFDARPLRDARAFRDLVLLAHPHRELLRRLVRTNPRCRRLGPWSPALLETVLAQSFARASWPDAQKRLATAQLTKYCDLNLLNLVEEVANKLTVEVRTLPVSMRAEPLLDAAALFVALLRRARARRPVEPRAPVEPTLAAARELFAEIGFEGPAARRLLACASLA